MPDLSGPSAFASRDPYYFGFRLREFAARNRWTDAQLASWLGCPEAALNALRLAPAPANAKQARALAEVHGVLVVKIQQVMGR